MQFIIRGLEEGTTRVGESKEEAVDAAGAGRLEAVTVIEAARRTK